MNPPIPTPQQWHDAPWHARHRWAATHGLTIREAGIVVAAGTLTPKVVAAVASRRGDDAYPPQPAHTAEEIAASLAGDGDPVVVAMRRAAATGLSLTHHDVTAGLPGVENYPRLRAVS